MSFIGMALMPISQVVSWYLIAVRPQQEQQQSLNSSSSLMYEGLFATSVFYACWALFNIIVRKRPDLGVVSMSLLAVASYLQRRTLALLATPVVIINYLLALHIVIGMLTKPTSSSSSSSSSNSTDDDKSSSTSMTLKKIWPWVFLGYVISNLVLYCFVEYKVWNLSTDGRSDTVKNSNHGNYNAVSSEEM